MTEFNYSKWREVLDKLHNDDLLAPLRVARYNGIDIWPLIKATVVMRFLNRLQESPYLHKKRFSMLNLRHWVETRRASALPSFPLIDAQIFCLANFAPTLEFRGFLINPHLDPLRNVLMRRGISSVAAYYDFRQNRNLVPALPSLSLGGAHAYVSRRVNQADAIREVASIIKPVNLFLERNDLGVDKELSRRIVYTTALKSFYAEVLRGSRSIKAVFLTNYYNPHGWAAVAAARELGLPSVDIQHGVQGPCHHAYSWPELGSSAPNVLPDLHLCWTAEDVENLEAYPHLRGMAKSIGPTHFQLDALAFGMSGKPQVHMSNALAAYREACGHVDELRGLEKANGRSIVGLFSQYKEKDSWLAALRQRLPDTVALWVRQHPGVKHHRHDIAKSNVCRTTRVNDHPIASVIRSLDLVVTGYSSVGIEAAHAGRPVLSYSPFSRSFLEPICRHTGYNLVSDDPDMLAAAIMEQLERRSPETSERRLPEIEEVCEWLLLRIQAFGSA